MRLQTCLALALLASCSVNGSPEPAQPPQPSGVNGSTRVEAPNPDEPSRSARQYSVAVSDREVLRRQASAVRAFVRFAASPTAKTAAAVPFSRSGITATFEAAEKHIGAEDLSNEAAWFLNDGEGTTSALFVISNSIKNAQQNEAGTTKFLATPRHMPICNDTPDKPPAGSASELLFVSLAPQETSHCAPGFRLALDIDTDGTIHAVKLAVRAP